MEISFRRSTFDLLQKYIELYKICFPGATRFTPEFLQWMYQDNPAGEAIGVDAFYGSEIVGQVMAIPSEYIFRGGAVRGLLAVNVAVRPQFQGRNLFKKLGLRLCELSAIDGYEFIIGVANQAATLGWTRQMGFQLVTPLNAVIGFGKLGIRDLGGAAESAELRHNWDMQALKWRFKNPLNPISVKSLYPENAICAISSAGIRGISAYAETPLSGIEINNFEKISGVSIFPRVFLGLIPGHRFGSRYFSIPDRFKPSPLNLIYKNLQKSADKIAGGAIFFNYLDFDAF